LSVGTTYHLTKLDSLRKLSLGLRRGGNNNTSSSNTNNNEDSNGNTSTTTTSNTGASGRFRDMGSSLRSLVTSSSQQQEPILDFRPRSQGRPSVPPPAQHSDLLTEKDPNKRKSGPPGGALVGEVEWIPDPSNQGFRAVVKPNRKSENLSSSATTTTTTSNQDNNSIVTIDNNNNTTTKRINITTTNNNNNSNNSNKNLGLTTTTSTFQNGQKNSDVDFDNTKNRRPPAFSEDNVPPTQDALYAKRVIEEAIEAELLALERAKNKRG
jgi:hypothetical protein